MSKCKFWIEEEAPYEMNEFYGTDVTCKYIALQNYIHTNYLTHKVQYCIKNAFAQKNSCSCNGNEKIVVFLLNMILKKRNILIQ